MDPTLAQLLLWAEDPATASDARMPHKSSLSHKTHAQEVDTLSEDAALDIVPLDTVASKTNAAHHTTLLQESLSTPAHLEETLLEPACLEDALVDTPVATTFAAHRPPPLTHSSALMEPKLLEDV